MATAAEKTEEELKREINELNQKQREINDRLRDPRNLRRGGAAGGGLASNGPRNFAAKRGYIRPGSDRDRDRFDSEDQPVPKRRLLSAVVKVKDGVAIEESLVGDGNGKEESITDGNDRRYSGLNRQRGGFRRGDGSRRSRTDHEDTKKEDVLRILSKATDPNRNKRMFGSILGTLEKFQKEDQHLSSTEAYMRRSDSLQRAEQRAREESEKLRLQEREKIAEKRKEDLTLRARVSAKAEQKKLELLFLHWSQHHNKLGNYLRTKAEPSIYYMPKKALEEDPSVAEQRKEKAFQEWKAARREELSEYQKQIEEQYLEKVDMEFERWQNARNKNNNNNNDTAAAANLQETMDKELETHQAEHGPKTTRKVVGNNEDDEEDVEDINVGEGEDDIMDDVLDVVSTKPDEAGNVSPVLDDI